MGGYGYPGGAGARVPADTGRPNPVQATRTLGPIRTVTDAPADPAGGTWNLIMKDINESTISDVGLHVDSKLILPMQPNTKYVIRLHAYFVTGAAGDFKYRITGPAAPTLVKRYPSRAAGGAAPALVAIVSGYDVADVALAGAGTDGIVDEEIIVHNGVNLGPLVFQWGQNTSDPVNTTVLAGSYLAWKIAA